MCVGLDWNGHVKTDPSLFRPWPARTGAENGSGASHRICVYLELYALKFCLPRLMVSRSRGISPDGSLARVRGVAEDFRGQPDRIGAARRTA